MRSRFSTGNFVTATEPKIHPTSWREAEIPADDVEDSSHISEYTDTTLYQAEEKEIVEENPANYVRHSSSPTVESIQGSKKKRVSNETFNNALLNLERQKVQYLQKKSSRQRDIDDEYLFSFSKACFHMFEKYQV